VGIGLRVAVGQLPAGRSRGRRPIPGPIRTFHVIIRPTSKRDGGGLLSGYLVHSRGEVVARDGGESGLGEGGIVGAEPQDRLVIAGNPEDC